MADTHVKIYAVTPRVQYVANGSTTDFPYEFAIFDETNMKVYVDGVLLDSGYSVTGVGEDDGGSVVFVSAPEADSIVTLVRNVPIERVTDFQEGGAFRPKNINDDLDRQTAFAQQLQEELGRTLRMPVAGYIGQLNELPLPDPGKTIIWNEDGTALINSQSTIDELILEVAKDENVVAVGTDLRDPDSAIKFNKAHIDLIEAAPQAAIDAQKWAVGSPEEPEEHSAKYWAEHASAIVDVDSATESREGIAKLATTSDAETGTNDVKIMTPLKTKKSIDKFGYKITKRVW